MFKLNKPLIEQELLNRGWTRHRLAKEAGVDPGAVKNHLDRDVFNNETVAKIAKALNKVAVEICEEVA